MTRKQRLNLRIDALVVEWRPDLHSERDGELSCTAYATVSYAIGDRDDRRCQTLSSGGLFGIDEPSPAYRKEIEEEQLEDLRAHLTVFGIQTDAETWRTLRSVMVSGFRP